MAEARSDEINDQVNSSQKRSLVGEIENKSSKKVKHDAMSDFKLVKVLSENARNKTIILHLQDKIEHKDAVSILEKTPFSNTMIDKILSSDGQMKVQFNNDIYSQLLCKFPEEINFVKNTLIYPATEKHVKKYSAQQFYLVAETPDVYKKVTLPFIKEQAVHLQWVYNILEKKAESDRIIYEDSHSEHGFIVLPDLKWEQTQMKSLYVMAICYKHGINTLRDLNSSHLPLLKNILQQGSEAILKTYNVYPSQLRVFVHYQPTYYHFHVHFTHVEYEAPGSVAGRAHLLQDIIDNIENIDSNYYAKRTLHFQISGNNSLFSCLKAAGVVNEIDADS
ncbi:m7GpppX diphosphatase-like [Dendronephthya gigantea]|uniref:m7GpppX diphosphatase-like n=1 Tax=Dendronephthya gigantea TaxID=151771 RepID=UPI00106BEE17|nr:m7GpppX diphosphatase-like [Dendronephthya gigantea]